MAVINTTVPTVASGAVYPAATYNTYLAGLFNTLQAARTSYVPTLTSTGTNPTLGTGSTTVGDYNQVGKAIEGSAEIVFGSAGVAAGTGTYRLLLPVATVASAVSAGRSIGNGVFFDASGSTFYNVNLLVSTSTTCTMTVNAASTVGAASPVVPAINDQIRVNFRYEAA